MLLYVHLIFRMLGFSGDWIQAGGFTALTLFFAFGLIVPVLLLYPGYLERFTGKRPVFLILMISLISLVWAPMWGLMRADIHSQLEQPLIVESGVAFFVSFNLLYSYVFQFYEKMGFYAWLKTKERFFYNDPPAHIRDFDKAASIYIGMMLVVVALVIIMIVRSYMEREWWQNRERSSEVQKSRYVFHNSHLSAYPVILLAKRSLLKPQHIVDFNQVYPHK